MLEFSNRIFEGYLKLIYLKNYSHFEPENSHLQKEIFGSFVLTYLNPDLNGKVNTRTMQADSDTCPFPQVKIKLLKSSIESKSTEAVIILP